MDNGAELHSDDERPELSVRVMSGLLLHFEKLKGSAALNELWQREKYSLPISHARNLQNFVSLRFTERLTTALAEASGQPDFVRQAAARVATPEGAGFAYYFLKAFGSPRLAYAKLVEAGSTFNRVGDSKIESLDDNSLVLRYQSRLPELNRNFCEGRQAQYAAITTIWGLPPAQVHESQCQVTGAEFCRYHLTWEAPLPALGRWVGLASATALATAGHLLRLGPSSYLLDGALLLAGAGWGSFFDRQKALRSSDALRTSQNEGLLKVLEDAQHRYDDVQRAKQEVENLNAELDQRVAERTAELAQSNQALESRSQELWSVNDQLSRALSRQKELDRLKTQFFDNVSHELRTPLTLILLSLEALGYENARFTGTELTQHLGNIQRSANKLLRLINNLLDLAKLESGKARLRYAPVEMASFLKVSLAPLRALADDRRLWMVVEGESVSAVHGDTDMLEDVFQNLVTNALKFTESGGVTVRIQETETQVRVEVSDTGCGMGEGDLPRIFDRFAQADSTGIRHLKGTGIGLALVKEMVELHGGSISVTSELEVGSTFRVLLPKGTEHIREDLRERRVRDLPVERERRSIKQEQLAEMVPAQDAFPRPPAPLPLTGQETPDARARRVLLVEDDADVRAAVSSVLSQHYLVLEAQNGEEGIKRARADRPDLVISDVMMPVMSGLQMTRALRESDRTADLPIILLTARRETDATLDGLTAGANDYVGKPFSPRELLARVETQLRLRDAAARTAENERLATLGLLTTGFAHDVRNPLNGLINCLEPLRSQLQPGGDLEQARSYIDLMREAGQRIHGLAESLLSFARPAGRRTDVQLTNALENTLKVMQYKIPKGVEVERDFQFAGSIEGEGGSLNQVWGNLIDNALRAMGNRGKLHLGVEQTGTDVLVTVGDSGVGISPDNLERLFQPFFSTRAAGDGTGLGLSMCRRIVLRHNGHIEVTSELGKGTRFTVRLPMKASADEAEPLFLTGS